MEYRSLGKTGLRVSEIGFGCGNTAGLLTGGDYDEQRKAIQRALDLGINYFDTAPNYGERVYERGRSESNLGKLLTELGARPVVGTKIELHSHDLNDIRGAVARSVDESLERLDVTAVDVLYLHNRIGSERSGDGGGAGTMGGRVALRDVLGPAGVLEAFQRQRSEGKVRFLAFCSTGSDPAANREIIEHGGFDCVQLSYSILEPTEGRLPPPGYRGEDYGQTIELAGEHQLGVVVIRVLGGGVLSGAREPHPLNTGSTVQRSYAPGAKRANALRFVHRPGEHTMAQAAIRYALTKPEVSTVLVGFSSVDQVDEAAAASGQGPLDQADLEQIEGLYATDFRVHQ
jgi:aryl-alcohol dehydrogenase-like predicted oxidoreductase